MMRSFALALVSVVTLAGFAAAQANDAPVIQLANPLAVSPGGVTKVLLRGFKFDDAKEVKATDGKATVKILEQKNADNLNMQDVKRVGDRQILLEVSVPADAAPGELGLIVVTGKGESPPYSMFVGGELAVVAETEPNDGFRQAQAISTGQIVDGAIHGERNVDCFVLEGQAGQKLTCEIFSDRRGANLDALLSLYNESGVLLATHDDLKNSRDARLEAALPAAGKYVLVVQDAHDLGGAAHAYRLIVR